MSLGPLAIPARSAACVTTSAATSLDVTMQQHSPDEEKHEPVSADTVSEGEVEEQQPHPTGEHKKAVASDKVVPRSQKALPRVIVVTLKKYKSGRTQRWQVSAGHRYARKQQWVAAVGSACTTSVSQLQRKWVITKKAPWLLKAGGWDRRHRPNKGCPP